jgi:general secretion pathway protein D
MTMDVWKVKPVNAGRGLGGWASWQTLVATVLSALMLLLLSGCGTAALRQAKDLQARGEEELAQAVLQKAVLDDPGNMAVRQAWMLQRDRTVGALAAQAEQARQAGHDDEVASLLQRMQAIAPDHPRTVALRSEVEGRARLQRLWREAQASFESQAYERAEASLRALLTENPGHEGARAMLGRIAELREQQARAQSSLTLATAMQPITLEFRDAPLKTVFEALARAANLNFVFDKDVRGEAKVTLFLRNTLVDEALHVILSTQQLGAKLLNDNTVLIYPATQQKQRDLLDTVTRTFYLVNADPKQAQTLIRTIAKTRDIYVDDRLNLLVVRDTPQVMRLIERLIANLDLPDPEVMLDLEVLEVSSKDVDQLGLSWPSTASYGVPDSTASLTTSSSLRWSVANPLALATLNATRGATNLLANPKIRARNREKAKILLGEKLPVFTTTTTANVGVSSSVNYIDVGLKLDIEPQVQLDGDVTMKVALEVSSVTDKTSRSDGSLAYQVGTRQASTTLRLRDGETQVLAGLLNDNESHSASGIPGLLDIPILKHLFGTITNSRDKTEVVLLVTPHIIRNIVQPVAASSFLPSGTEAQPGAAPLQLRQGEARSSGGIRGNVGGPRMGAMGNGRPGAPAEAQRLSGPDEVLPGATFRVTVRNPDKVPMSAALLVDDSVLEPVGATKTSGLSFTLQPGQQTSFTFRSRADVRDIETELRLDVGGEPLRLKVRSPEAAAAAQDAPTPAPSDPPPEPEPAGDSAFGAPPSSSMNDAMPPASLPSDAAPALNDQP